MRHGIALALAFFSIASASAAADDGGFKWYAGAGIGVGLNARYTLNGQHLSFDDGMPGATDKSGLAALNIINVGVELNSKTLLGFGGSLVAQTGKVNGNDAQIQINNYHALLTYFPFERGFFVRGGGGLSSIYTNDATTKVHNSGVGVLVGAGYALNLVTHHYLTFTLDQSFQFYSSSTNKPKNSEFSAFYLGYMYRR